MATLTRTTALFATAGVFAWGPALAQTPSQADFDACNQEAKLKAGSPSASPSTSGGASGSASGSGTTGAGSSGSTVSGGSAGSGTTPGTGTSGTTSGTTGGSTSAAGSADKQLSGMAAVGQTDEAYKQAYRDCMKQRGF